MRTFLLAAVFLLAAPLSAQTGDCTAETGTTTAWAWSNVEIDRGKLTFTFYAVGLAGYDSRTFTERFAPGSDLSALADGRCADRDEERLVDEIDAASAAVLRNPAAEDVTPAYPENCAAPPVTPNNPTKTAEQHCRTARFHQRLIRAVWTFDAGVIRDRFFDVWDWVDQTGPAGPGFNTGNKQAWLAVTGTEWSNAVNQRMNNMEAFVSAFDEDQQWAGELEDFN